MEAGVGGDSRRAAGRAGRKGRTRRLCCTWSLTAKPEGVQARLR